MSSEEARPPQMADLRARKSGIALRIQRKLEQRYDEETAHGTQEAILKWVDESLAGEHEPLDYDKKKGLPWRLLQEHLKDGVALCMLMNKLLASEGKPQLKFQTPATTAFTALANIELFNQGALDYGVPEVDCFQSIDLYEGYKGPLMNVINCVNKLGVIAAKKGQKPEYLPPLPPGRDSELWGDT